MEAGSLPSKTAAAAAFLLHFRKLGKLLESLPGGSAGERPRGGAAREEPRRGATREGPGRAEGGATDPAARSCCYGDSRAYTRHRDGRGKEQGQRRDGANGVVGVRRLTLTTAYDEGAAGFAIATGQEAGWSQQAIP